ncbi:hypothetical protein Arad_12448 (plasmid) [Rhizobium rhizogenes K84]|uniref:Uncharacterized protein n=1 Tax=Rhizobium rhizogenes (strain K84 / ATCC BAA-868) TaxID=311403 RepID=B9JQJ2_RHIR8|nr:hypothetical protein Arad_12448 [Rhizobium rhizogenes K84]
MAQKRRFVRFFSLLGAHRENMICSWRGTYEAWFRSLIIESNNDASHDTSNSRMFSPTEHRGAFSPAI